MIKKIDECVEMITLTVEEFAEGAVIVAMIITSPVWLVPYMVYKKMRKNKKSAEASPQREGD